MTGGIVPETEIWLRGPVDGVPDELQPVAHCLLQAFGEIRSAVASFPLELLWSRPGGVASVGFHLQHITGVLDRLFTYANGHALSAGQLQYLAAEGTENPEVEVLTLMEKLHHQLVQSIDALKATDPGSLSEQRLVGRKKMPSTKRGLYFHAAEHTMRHTGQLLVTCKVVIP
jgi:uncharacterized damage-inducible protein DinB